MAAEMPRTPRTAVDSHLLAIPRNLFSQRTSLAERERNLQQYAATVRSQIAEIQRRSTTLQQYANDLIEMDKKLRAAENELEVQYKNRISEIADQEEEYLHTLAQIREQKKGIDQRLSHYSQVSATIVDSITATAKEESELKVANVNIESLTTQARKRIAQISLERLHFEVGQEEKRIEEIKYAIDQELVVLKEISAQGDDLLQTLNQVICH
jgi:chromosome segregation ATPase